MGKTLLIIAASALLIPALNDESYAQRRGGIRGGVGEAVRRGVAEGGAQGISKAFDSLFTEDPEKAYQSKRDYESKVFGCILKYNDKNHTESGDLVRRIVENSVQYQSSLSEDRLAKFNDFYKDIDSKDSGRQKLVSEYSKFFAWRLFPDRLDIAELHLLYNLRVLEDGIKQSTKNKDKEKTSDLREKLYDFKQTLYPAEASLIRYREERLKPPPAPLPLKK